MNVKTLRILCFCLSVAALAAAGARAQGPPPGGPGGGPGGGHQPGMPGGPGMPGPRPDASHPPGAPGAAPGQPRNALQFGPVGRWWDDRSVVSSLGLSRQQQKRMDSIFDANRSAIVSSYKTFLKAQSSLDAINKAAHPDQGQLFTAIDAVNQARASLQKAASAMLLQIRSEMTPDQVQKLESLK